MNTKEIITARGLDKKGLSVQAIAYRLGIDIFEIQENLLSKSYINEEGKLKLY